MKNANLYLDSHIIKLEDIIWNSLNIIVHVYKMYNKLTITNINIINKLNF